MAEWPDLEALKRELDVESEDFDDDLENVLSSAIARVRADAELEEDDDPNESQSAAALRAAVLLQPNAGDSHVIDTDPVYAGHMTGQRRVFGFS